MKPYMDGKESLRKEFLMLNYDIIQFRNSGIS